MHLCHSSYRATLTCLCSTINSGTGLSYIMEDYDMGIPVDRAALETTLADAVNLAPSIMVESALFGKFCSQQIYIRI